MPADPPKIAHGEKVALALGAGGARGLAQIGVIEALLARGLRIDTVAGSSSGALVGGIFAAGRLPAFRERLEAMSRADFLRLLADPAFGQGGLFRGQCTMIDDESGAAPAARVAAQARPAVSG